MATPQPAIVGGRPSSPSPANAAAATALAIPAPPDPPPLHYLHQELPLPLVNPSPYSILIETHCGGKLTLSPKPPSAAELAAGDSLHLRLPCDHRKDRLGVADPSLLLDAREKTPFAGDDHRMPRLCSGREEEGVGTGQT